MACGRFAAQHAGDRSPCGPAVPVAVNTGVSGATSRATRGIVLTVRDGRGVDHCHADWRILSEPGEAFEIFFDGGNPCQESPIALGLARASGIAERDHHWARQLDLDTRIAA